MPSPQVQAITGMWWNYEGRNAFMQYRLTLSSRTGGVLLGAIVVAVRISGSATWTITAYFLHRARAGTEPIDGLDLQINILLRNAPGPEVMLWRLFMLWLTWRGHAENVPRRLLKIAFFPALISICFTAASLTVSKVATDTSPVSVRVAARNCGVPVAVSGPLPDAVAFTAKNANDTRIAAAQIDDLTSSGASRFDITTSTATCPFIGQGRCVETATNHDSGALNSNSVFKINAPPEEQVNFRTTQTCAVLSTKDVVQAIPDTSVRGQEKIFLVYLGQTVAANFTFTYPSRFVNSSLPYTLNSVYTYAGSSSGSAWIPSFQVNVSRADVTIHLIAPNAVEYIEPSLSPMFSASGQYNRTTADGTILYKPDYYFSIIACTRQYAYENPTTNATTGLLGYLQAYNNSLNIGLNAAQIATVDRLHLAAWYGQNYNTVSGQGVDAIAATKLLNGLISTAPSPNQSQVEFERWFQTGLANMRNRVADFPTNAWYTSTTRGLTVKPASAYTDEVGAALQRQCTAQLANASGGYMDFLFAAVLIVIIACPLLILTSWTIDSIVAKIEGYQGHKYFAYVADSLYNLGRAAVRGRGWQNTNTPRPYREEIKEQLPLLARPEETNGSIDYPQHLETQAPAFDNDSGYQERI